MLFSQQMPDLAGGVAQVPDYLKAPNEFTEMVNFYIDRSRRLRRRPPTNHVDTLAQWTTQHDNCFIHQVDRTDTERYTVVITDGDLKVYNTLTGQEYSVSFPDGKDYLSYTGSNKWRALTIGDSTFFVNRDVEVGVERDTSGAAGVDPIILRMDPAKFDYEVSKTEFLLFGVDFSDNHYAAEITPWYEVRGQVTQNDKIDGYRRYREKWLDRFYEELIAASGRPPVFSVLRYGDLIYIMPNHNTATLNFKTKDINAPHPFKVYIGSVESIEDLPALGPPGVILRIHGDKGTTKDDTWVISEPVNPEISRDHGAIVWRETIAPNTPYRLDRSTMPHVLERNARYRKDLTGRAGVFNWPDIEFTPVWGEGQALGATLNIGGEPVDGRVDHVINTSGEGLDDGGSYSPPSPSTVRPTVRYTVRWNLDTSLRDGMETRVIVEFWNDDTELIHTRTFRYTNGMASSSGSRYVSYGDQEYSVVLTHSDVGTWPVHVKIRLEFDEDPTETPPPAAFLTLRGTDSGNPWCYVERLVATDMFFGPWHKMFPAGTEIYLNMEGDLNALPVTPTDLFTEDLILYIGLYVRNELGYDDEPLPITPGHPVGIRISRSAGGGIPVGLTDSFGYYYMDPLTIYNSSWDFTPNSLVGMRLVNETTGAEGLIANNGRYSIQVEELLGGTRDYFEEGDTITIYAGESGSFTFRQVEWADRRVGDLESSPWPSFVGRKISDVFYHRTRLGFISEDAVVFSGAQDLFRFFRRTTTQVLEDDPIDVEVGDGTVVNLTSAVEWNGALYLGASGGRQYVVTADSILSPQNVSVTHISSYETSDYCRPYRLGQSLILTQKKAGYSLVRDYFESVYGRLSSTVLTDRVERYIEGDVIDMAGDPDLGILCILTNGEKSENTLYVWQYNKTEVETTMSAWHKWTFPRVVKIHAISMYKGVLYIYSKANLAGMVGSWLLLERMDLNDRPDITFGFQDGWGYHAPVVYESMLTFPTFYMRNGDGTPVLQGRTQMRFLWMRYSESPRFDFTTTPPYGPRRTYSKSSGAASGVFEVPLMSTNEGFTLGLTSNAGFNLCVDHIEYEGFHHQRNESV